MQSPLSRKSARASVKSVLSEILPSWETSSSVMHDVMDAQMSSLCGDGREPGGGPGNSVCTVQ